MTSNYYVEPTYRISYRFRRILVPVDGSEPSLTALDLALDFAQRYGSKVTVLHVSTSKDEAEKVLEKARKRAERYTTPIQYKYRTYNPSEGSVAGEIIAEILQGGYDAVFLGARGTTLSEDIHIGSTALAVLANTPITIVVVR